MAEILKVENNHPVYIGTVDKTDILTIILKVKNNHPVIWVLFTTMKSEH